MTASQATEVTALVPMRSEMSREQIDLLKRTICNGATDDELKLFVMTSERLRLDPFARQVFAVKRPTWDPKTKTSKDVMSIQVSIDGFRLVAERTAKYAGQLGPFWTADGKEWHEVWLDSAPPKAAKVAVMRHDFKEPLWGVATWEQYKQAKRDGTLSPMWQKMGPLMLAKCAEALALRRAFPNELSGVYTQEEMAQATVAEVIEPPRDIGSFAGDGTEGKGSAPKASGAPRAAAPSSAESAPPSAGATSTKPRNAAAIVHNGVMASKAQIAKLHMYIPQITTIWRCDDKKECQDAKPCGYHGKLRVYRDQKGERIRSSKDLSFDQASYFLDWCERTVEARKLDEPSRHIDGEPEREHIDQDDLGYGKAPEFNFDDYPPQKDDIDALTVAAVERWGADYKGEFQKWLEGAFNYDSIFAFESRREVRDAIRMLKEGR